ncbi:MAG TPA: CPBP family intramembrane glutamic endopeptidase [Terriglobia bacterium]|jgi:membrane protease YdiL (CAAX protease family)
MADLGWGKTSRPLAIVLGTLLGVLWGAFGSFGYLQFVKDANILEMSLFRLFMAVAGALVAVLEDCITRGLVMNELQRMGSSKLVQVLASSVLFSLYHSIWRFNMISFTVGLIYGLMLSGLFVLGRRSLTPVILGHGLALLLGEPFLTMSLLQAIKLGR